MPLFNFWMEIAFLDHCDINHCTLAWTSIRLVLPPYFCHALSFLLSPKHSDLFHAEAGKRNGSGAVFGPQNGLKQVLKEHSYFNAPVCLIRRYLSNCRSNTLWFETNQTNKLWHYENFKAHLGSPCVPKFYFVIIAWWKELEKECFCKLLVNKNGFNVSKISFEIIRKSFLVLCNTFF